MTADSPTSRAGATPLWRDVRVLRIAAQVAVVGAVGLLAAFMVGNMLSAMSERGLGFGFSFLGRQAGFEISETPIPYSAREHLLQAFLVGLLNTLFVSVVGIVLATILGIVVGVARLSPNWLLRTIAGGYVELIRNTPLLVQLFFIYFTFIQLPSVAQTRCVWAISGFLNQRGAFVPAPQASGGFRPWLAIHRGRHRRGHRWPDARRPPRGARARIRSGCGRSACSGSSCCRSSAGSPSAVRH